jgi:hypothetical protein
VEGINWVHSLQLSFQIIENASFKVKLQYINEEALKEGWKVSINLIDEGGSGISFSAALAPLFVTGDMFETKVTLFRGNSGIRNFAIDNRAYMDCGIIYQTSLRDNLLSIRFDIKNSIWTQDRNSTMNCYCLLKSSWEIFKLLFDSLSREVQYCMYISAKASPQIIR